MAKRSEAARKGIRALIEKGRARRRMKTPHVPREGQTGWVPKTPVEIARQAARQKSKAVRVTDLPKSEQATIAKALKILERSNQKAASPKVKAKKAKKAAPLTKRNQRLLETQARLQKPVRKSQMAKTLSTPVTKARNKAKTKISAPPPKPFVSRGTKAKKWQRRAAVPAGVAGAAYYLGRDKPGKWQDYTSIRAAKSAGSLYYSKDGTKKAAVYKGDLKPGQSLRDYMNEKTGKTRRTNKAGGGAVKKYQGGGLSRAQQNMLRQAQEYAETSGQYPQRLRALTDRYGDLWGASQQKKARGQLTGRQPGRTSVRAIGPGMKSGGAAKKKSGGAVKMQGGGMRRGEPTTAGGRSTKRPAKTTRPALTDAEHQAWLKQHDEWMESQLTHLTPAQRAEMDAFTKNFREQGMKKAKIKRELKKAPPGRKIKAVRGGWKKGGTVKKQTGGTVGKRWHGVPPPEPELLTRGDQRIKTPPIGRGGRSRGTGGGPPVGNIVMSGSGGMKSGGAVKKMQSGGLSRAQRNLLRGAQELAATSGQNPAALRKLTAQYGDLYAASQQRKAIRELSGSLPGRKAMRGIGPGGKSGGVVKKQRGGTIGNIKDPWGIRGHGPGGALLDTPPTREGFQSYGRDFEDPYGQLGGNIAGEEIRPLTEAEYRRRQVRGVKRGIGRTSQGRAAASSVGGGMKHGGAVKRKSKPRGVGVAKRGFGRALG